MPNSSAAGHRGALCRDGRAVAVADAGSDAPRPSVSDLGAVRCAGAELGLRRISRAGRRAGGRPCRPRRQAGRIRADPSRQLHRGRDGLVRLRRARRHCRHHQHPLGAGRDGIFCGSLRRGCRDHAACLCRDDRPALPELALARGDFARRRRRACARPRRTTRRSFRSAVRRQRRPAAPHHRPVGAMQRAIYLGHHIATESGAMDPCQCAVGRQGQRVASGSAPRRRAPDLPAAVSYQCAGLLDAGEPVGRGFLRDPAAVFREPVLEGRRSSTAAPGPRPSRFA